jgi:SHS2 domain-containing protein
MDQFHLLEHTADVGIKALAGRREQLAEQSALGLRLLLFGDTDAAPRQIAEIAAEGNSGAETLVNWLNELLFVWIENQLVPATIDVTCFTEKKIIASVSGEIFEPGKHQMLREIKAVTHHQASVGHENGHWTSTVYLDL